MAGRGLVQWSTVTERYRCNAGLQSYKLSLSTQPVIEAVGRLEGNDQTIPLH